MAAEKILVIDDELVMCNLLSDILKDEGYEVAAAQSGPEGLRIFKEDSFDLIITDIRMPEMEGLQVLGEVKKFDPDAVVILITAYASFETVQEALRLGAYDYITKPFDSEKIRFVVEKGLEARRLIVENKRLTEYLKKHTVELEEELEAKIKELSLLYKIGQEVASKVELDKILKIVMDRAAEVLDSRIGSILLVDPTTGELSIRWAKGLDREVVKATRLKKGEGISGWVFQQKEAILVEDLARDPRFSNREKERYYTKSLISAPLVFKDEVLGVFNLNDKGSGERFNDYDLRLLEGIAVEAAIAVRNIRIYKDLQDVYMLTLKALAATIDARDKYTRTHSENVTKYAVAIAQELKLPAQEVEVIREACQLHDLGKIGVHDYILTKPGKLTEEEWEEVKLHSLKGTEILRPLPFLNDVIELIRHHHERWDGKGYPDAHKGQEIILGARIMAVADAFDAMISERPYRKAYSKEGAIEEFKRNSGTQFDPHVVKAFLRVLKKEEKLRSRKGGG